VIPPDHRETVRVRLVMDALIALCESQRKIWKGPPERNVQRPTPRAGVTKGKGTLDDDETSPFGYQPNPIPQLRT